jgi:hypothetical protein
MMRVDELSCCTALGSCCGQPRASRTSLMPTMAGRVSDSALSSAFAEELETCCCFFDLQAKAAPPIPNTAPV